MAKFVVASHIWGRNVENNSSGRARVEEGRYDIGIPGAMATADALKLTPQRGEIVNI